MAEVLVEFSEPLVLEDERQYVARACGSEMENGHWQGWLEFVPVAGGDVLRSARETTQPNRADAVYWATGLTPVYLEGSLERTINPRVMRPPRAIDPPFYDEPAPDAVPGPPRPESILNPFSVYRKGEGLLRDQLHALSPWHLVNIIKDYGFGGGETRPLSALPKTDLIELIVAGVRKREQTSVSR
jgi:hypothetical protein